VDKTLKLLQLLHKNEGVHVSKTLACSALSNGQFEEWCIADEQTPDEVPQKALDWACGMGGADCTKIQRKKPCYYPNTLKDHASYAFNNYYQKFKKRGATCYFSAAAIITDLDPSKFHHLIHMV
ncbi:X8 domain, partial [Dillenia turbinata]